MTRLPYNKYHAIKTTIDGITFDSKAEARRYVDLTLMRQAKVIKDFTRQPEYELVAGIKYRGDFLVIGNDGKQWVEDVKGMETDVFKIKKKLFNYFYPHLELKLIK